MIFSESDAVIDLLGVYKIERSRIEFHTDKRNLNVLSYRLSGEAQMNCRNAAIAVHRGDILYIPANLEYSQSTSGELIIAVHFNLQNYSGHEIEVLTPPSTAVYDELFYDLLLEWVRKECGYKRRCTSMLYRMLSMLEVQCSGRLADEQSGKISRSVEYLNSHFFDASLSVSRLSEMAGISEVYFRKLFYRRFSQTPSSYITGLRIDYAKDLLRSGYYSVSEVAAKSGFSDAKYFSSRFKKVTGATPCEFCSFG